MTPKILTAIHFALLLLAITGTNAQEIFGTVSTERYEITVYEGKFSFTEARNRCNFLGSELLKVDSQNITDAIAPYLSATNWRWIGAADVTRDGRFWWLDGDLVSRGYSNWKTGHPLSWNGYNDCVLVGEHGIWFEWSCDFRTGFICQKAFKLSFENRVFEFYRNTSDKTDYHGAVTRCAGSASRLAVVDSKNLSYIIKKNIRSGGAYWIGGRDAGGNKWKWNNQDDIKYFDWMDHRAYRSGEAKCLLTYKYGWVTFDCSREQRFICEQVGTSKVKVSNFAIDVFAKGNASVRCSAKGLPTPVITWQKHGIVLAQGPSSRVFQTTMDEGAILNLVGATILDEGVYVCTAYNTIEGTRYEEKAATAVSVISYADIIDAFGNTCNSSITILWKPSKRAKNALHRFELKANFSITFNYTVAPNASGTFNYTVALESQRQTFLTHQTRNLSDYTYYNITITPCPTPTECRSRYAISTMALSGGFPEFPFTVISPKASARSPTTCVVTWRKPNWMVGKLTHQITVVESMVEVIVDGFFADVGTYLAQSENDTSYVFVGKPNRKYAFGIQTEACGRMGPTIWSKGTCRTLKQVAPDTTLAPAVDTVIKNGEAMITVELSDEAMEVISFLFLIVGPHLDYDIDWKNFTEADLAMFNASSKDNSSNGFRVALVLSPLNISETEKRIILGDGSSTSCIVGGKLAGKGDKYVGSNEKLDQLEAYSVFLVSTVPTGEGMFFLTISKPLKLVQGEGYSVALIVTVVSVTSLSLLATAIFFICDKWFLSERPDNPAPQQEEVEGMETSL